MALPTIASLWVGEELSWLEQLCLKSFHDHGHDVVLFTYDEVKGIPEGVRQRDANDILPSDNIIRHAKTGSPAYHADVFRLHMLYQTDYVWADTDAFCCQPWKLKGKHFHGWISDEKPLVNNGVLRLPKTSKTLKAMMKFTSDEYPIPPWYSDAKQADLQARKDRGDGEHVSLLPWGVWGPDALTWFLKDTGEIKHSKPGHVIYPVPFKNAGVTLNPNRRDQAKKLILDDTLSIHFWGRRFRNIAAKYDGVPSEGSYVHELLKKHDIDPHETRHMMAAEPTATAVSDAIDPSALDFSMFTDADVGNLVLQRSEIGPVGPEVNAWIDGDDTPLLAYAAEHREKITQDAFKIAQREFENFAEVADDVAPKRTVDIGCGYGLVDLILYRKFGCDLVLIDIEDSEDRHFGYRNQASGYSNLRKARTFLEKNGVPPEKITTVNPLDEDTDFLGEFDLAISLYSCGFHFPISTYGTLFGDQMNDQGAIVLDVRRGSGGISALKEFGTVDVLIKHSKYSTVLTRIGQAK